MEFWTTEEVRGRRGCNWGENKVSVWTEISDKYFPMHVHGETIHVKPSESEFPWIYQFRQYHATGDLQCTSICYRSKFFYVFFFFLSKWYIYFQDNFPKYIWWWTLPFAQPLLTYYKSAAAAAAAAKSLQLYPTLCDPIDSPPGSPIPGILQARTLEWVAIAFSNAWKGKVKVKSLSLVRL